MHSPQLSELQMIVVHVQSPSSLPVVPQPQLPRAELLLMQDEATPQDQPRLDWRPGRMMKVARVVLSGLQVVSCGKHSVENFRTKSCKLLISANRTSRSAISSAGSTAAGAPETSPGGSDAAGLSLSAEKSSSPSLGSSPSSHGQPRYWESWPTFGD